MISLDNQTTSDSSILEGYKYCPECGKKASFVICSDGNDYYMCSSKKCDWKKENK